MDDEAEPIIIDMGSDTLKAGFASDDHPKVMMPMMIGEPKAPGILVGMDQKDYYVGFECLSKQQFLNMEFPVQKGRVQNIESIQKMIDYLMNNELSKAPDEHKILITEPPGNTSKNREELCSLM
jgi:actin-related protein